MALVLAPTAARSHETGRHGREDLRTVADRIAGGATLLSELDSYGASRELHDRAHRFQEMVRRGRWRGDQLASEWERLRRAFEETQQSLSRNRSDARVTFLLAHLDEDFAAAAPLIGTATSGGGGGSEGWIGLLQNETCLGVHNVGKRPCPRPRESVSFRIPKHVTEIRRLRGVWRDFGGGAKAVVLLDGQPVWQTDVGKDWEADARTVNLRVRPGSKLTIQSAKGDPLWIRQFDMEAVEREEGGRWPF